MPHFGPRVFGCLVLISVISAVICFSYHHHPWSHSHQKACSTCGVGNLFEHWRKKRVIDGHYVMPWNKYPWLVLVETRDPDSHSKYTCVGSIISSTYVLTAAHCFLRKEEASSPNCSGDTFHFSCFHPAEKVRVYSLSFTGVKPNLYPLNPQKVQRILPFPGYRNKEDSENDIALLELRHPFHCSESVSPICLPWVDTDLSFVATAGWGRDDPMYGFKHNVPLLKEGVLEVIPPEECKIRDTDTRPLHTLFCTTGFNTGQSPCMGDSGSPMIANDAGYFYATGIFAGVEDEHCNPDDPISSTKVLPYVPWIQQHVFDLPVPPINSFY